MSPVSHPCRPEARPVTTDAQRQYQERICEVRRAAQETSVAARDTGAFDTDDWIVLYEHSFELLDGFAVWAPGEAYRLALLVWLRALRLHAETQNQLFLGDYLITQLADLVKAARAAEKAAFEELVNRTGFVCEESAS